MVYFCGVNAFARKFERGREMTPPVTICPPMPARGYRRGSWTEEMAAISPVPADEVIALGMVLSAKRGAKKGVLAVRRRKNIKIGV